MPNNYQLAFTIIFNFRSTLMKSDFDNNISTNNYQPMSNNPISEI